MEIVNQEVLQYIEWYEVTYPEYDQWTCTAIKEWIVNTHNADITSHAVQYIRVRNMWSSLLNAHCANKGQDLEYCAHPFLHISKAYFDIDLLTAPEDEPKVYARVIVERKAFIEWVKEQLNE